MPDLTATGQSNRLPQDTMIVGKPIDISLAQRSSKCAEPSISANNVSEPILYQHR